MAFKFSLPGEFGGIGSSLYHMSHAIRLVKLFKEHMQGDYLKTIDEFCVILRVSGDVTDYGGDGPELLRYQKKSRYIKVDFVIPESKWRGRSPEFIKNNFCNGIRECFRLMVERAEKAKELIDKQKLIDDFEKSMALFEVEA